MERVFGLKSIKHKRAHINPKMAEGNVPLLRSKADEGQRLSGGGVGLTGIFVYLTESYILKNCFFKSF